MNHWIMAPLVLPAVVAAIILLWLRYRLVTAQDLSLATYVALWRRPSSMVGAAAGPVQSQAVGD